MIILRSYCDNIVIILSWSYYAFYYDAYYYYCVLIIMRIMMLIIIMLIIVIIIMLIPILVPLNMPRIVRLISIFLWFWNVFVFLLRFFWFAYVSRCFSYDVLMISVIFLWCSSFSYCLLLCLSLCLSLCLLLCLSLCMLRWIWGILWGIIRGKGGIVRGTLR